MQGATRVDLTASLDLSIADFVLLADGRTVLLAAEEGAQTRLFSVPVTGGPVTPRPLQGAGVISSLAAEAGQSHLNADLGQLEFLLQVLTLTGMSANLITSVAARA
jgi:hypothetical protein